MSPAQQVIHVIEVLVAEQLWSPTVVGSTTQVTLPRHKEVSELTKMYLGTGGGLFRQVKLLVQTFEGRTAPSIYVSCDWEAHVTRADLSELIPSNTIRKLNPPPTPGSKGPLRVATTLSVQRQDTNMSFGFESRDKSPDYLRAFSLERPRATLAPADFLPECFRAYQVNTEDEPYAIERRSTRQDAVLVSDLKLAERNVQLSFKTVEAPVSEPLARKLIDQLLLGELLKEKLAGKYDSVDYLATELGSITHVRNAGTSR